MYSSRLRWAIVNEDRHCGARRRRARIPWSIEVLGPAWSRTSSMRDVAGICGTIAGTCWTLRDFAGPCWTMLDHLRGTRGMIGPIAHDRPLHDSKQWAPLWKLGGDAHHYRFFLPDGAGCRWRSLVTWGEGQTSLSKPPRHVIGLSGYFGSSHQ